MPFAIDPVCGKLVDATSTGLEITTNGIAFPFCGEKCAEEFKRNELDYLYCPWKPKQKIDPNISLSVYGRTVYFCCEDCRVGAKVFVAIQTNSYGFLGVRVKIDQARARRNLDNFAVVIELIRGSPAAKLGIEENSSILRIDGQEMNDYRKFMRWIRLSTPGQTAVLSLRTPDGKTKTLKLVLGKRGKRRGGFVY